MIALLIVNLCIVLWFFASLGSERRKRVALENAMIGGFADARKRECEMSDRLACLETEWVGLMKIAIETRARVEAEAKKP